MPTEQLKVEAVLDTSNLRRDADEATSQLERDLDRVQDKAEQAGNSVEDIGSAARSAASDVESSLTRALDKVEAKAKTTANTLKQVNFKQGLGIAANAIEDLGSAISENSEDSTAGQAIGGALQWGSRGARIGAAAGPVGAALGAAAGALGGAAAALLDSAAALKAAAVSEDEQIRAEASPYVTEYENRQRQAFREKEAKNIIDGATSSGDIQKRRDAFAAQVAEMQKQYDALVEDFRRNPEADGTKSLEELNKIRQDKLQNIKELYDNLQSNAAILAMVDGQLADVKNAELAAAQEKERQEKEAAKAAEEKRKAEERAAEEAKKEAERKAEAAQREAERAQREAAARAAEETRRKEEAAAKDKLRGEIGSLKDESSGITSEMDKVKGQARTITDSLVRVGAATGYSGINNAINTNVSNILRLLQRQYDYLQRQLANKEATLATWSA